MQKCQQCGVTERFAYISGKSSDCNSGDVCGVGFEGYVPDDIGIGGGDYIEFIWCLDCGQIQGQWPAHPNLDDQDSDTFLDDEEEEAE